MPDHTTPPSSTDEFMSMSVEQLLKEFGMAGSMQTDAEWDTMRDKLLNDLGNMLNLTRGHIRSKVLDTMLRLDEEER